MSINILNSRTIYEQDDMTFVEKEAAFPKGVVKKACIDHPGAVVIVPFTDDGQIVLIRQYRLGAEQNFLEVPAGTIEEGESPREAAERELQEEAGYFPETLLELEGFYIMPGVSNEYLHLFVARELRPSKLRESTDEVIEVLQMPVKEAMLKLSKGEIRDAKTIIGLLRTTSSQL